MQNRKAIKWSIWGLLVICLGQALYIYLAAPGRPEPTRVVSVTEVGEGGAVYELLYDSGGATVPVVYRYFLMALQSSDAEALHESKRSTPFLVTKSSKAVREVSGDHVKLKVSGTIYEFHSISLFKINDEIHIVKFDLDSTAP